MRLLKPDEMNKLIKRLQEIIENKNDGLNNQNIDKEISAFISVYKYGNTSAKNYAAKWLCSFSVNAEIIKNSYTLGWKTEIEEPFQMELF